MEISEKKIIIVSLVLVVVGIVALELVSSTMTYEEFSRLSEGTRVVMEGQAVSVQEREEMVLFRLKTECEIPVVVFDDVIVPEFVRVEGSKEKYKGEEQILADTIAGIEHETLS